MIWGARSRRRRAKLNSEANRTGRGQESQKKKKISDGGCVSRLTTVSRCSVMLNNCCFRVKMH